MTMPRRRALVALATAALLPACTDASIAAPARELPSPDIVARGAETLRATRDSDVTLPDVPLAAGSRATLVATVFSDGRVRPCGPEGTVLAISGFAHTAATWTPLADALLERAPRRLCRIVALDLPGHGRSGLPDAAPFGTLTLDDYAAAVIGAAERLTSVGLGARGVLAHSQGGLVVQMAQERLLAEGASLRDRLDVRAAVLLASVPSRDVPWAFAESGTAAALLESYLVTSDPALGPHARVPTAAWPALFFTAPDGVPSPGTPTPAAMSALGYDAPEPLHAALQLVGGAPFTRPGVREGAFAAAHGTRLAVVAYVGDAMLRPDEERALYRRLTGDDAARHFTLVGGPEAVHDMHVASPHGVRDAVERGLR